jgi:Uma2 family endonuclease
MNKRLGGFVMIVNSTDFKANSGEYLDKLSDVEDVYILRDGEPIAKLVEYTHLTAYEFLKENANAYDYTSKEISYEDFIVQYEKTDDRLEYIDGRVYAMGSPSVTHQSIVVYLINSFYTFLKGKKCQPFVAPFDVHFEATENKACVQPDIIIMCDQENVTNEKYYGIPTLVVEVLSPSSRSKDTMIKLNLYQREGVSEYLLVDSKNQVVHYWYFKNKELVIHTELGVDQTFESSVFEGLKVDIKEMFGM